MNLYSIGVYGWTAESFFRELEHNTISTVIDVRQRRGVRGSEYSFSNAKRLGAQLDEMGIGYIHWKELAPTKEIRALQHLRDAEEGVKKRDRATLSSAFIGAYNSQVLEAANHAAYADDLRVLSPAALLCVEHHSDACHRSLIAGWLATADPTIEVINL